MFSGRNFATVDAQTRQYPHVAVERDIERSRYRHASDSRADLFHEED